MDHQSEQALIKIVREAGAKLLEFWPGQADARAQPAQDLNVCTKADGSFVTAADFASNKLIVEGIQSLFPEDGVYSEELPASKDLAQKERVWIIDPLDGTQSFIDGNDDFSVLVALCVGLKPVFGLMYFPARNAFASAHSTHGAFLDSALMRVSAAHVLRDKAVYLRHLKLPPRPCFYDRWMDSGLAFLTLCKGDFDGIILKIVSHQEWDLAAPTVMILESGGMVSDEQGRPIEFKKAPMNYKYFVASNGRVHDQLLALIPKE